MERVRVRERETSRAAMCSWRDDGTKLSSVHYERPLSLRSVDATDQISEIMQDSIFRAYVDRGCSVVAVIGVYMAVLKHNARFSQGPMPPGPRAPCAPCLQGPPLYRAPRFTGPPCCFRCFLDLSSVNDRFLTYANHPLCPIQIKSQSQIIAVSRN